MSKLLTLVQIAKRDLAMDDDVYRDILEEISGKRSARGLSDFHLSKVLDRMKGLGFKPKFKRPLKPRNRALEVTKIRAIWITMHKQGFVRNGSDAAINAYVRRMTTRTNGRGIERAEWLKPEQASEVLEALKKWHYRLMKDAIINAGGRIPKNDSLTGYAGYDKLSAYYEEKFCEERE